MNTKAKDQPRRKYDDEFKRQALQMIANGQAVRSVAQALGIGENLLHKWKQAARASESPDEREVSELRARLRQVEQERDILKNVWLRRRSQPRNESCWHKAGRMQQMYPACVE